MSKKKILIAAGGTGGHIFPAIYVAKSLLELEPECEIVFIGTGRPLEEKLIGGAGFQLKKIKMVGVSGRGIKGILEFLTVLPSSFLTTWNLISEFKPDLIFGFGGYGSFLPVTIGALRGISTWIHEAEASPGLANKILGMYVDRISTAFSNLALSKKRLVYTGHPVRTELLSVSKKHEINSVPEILVVGGSQGAKSLDNVVVEIAPELKKLNLKWVHQTRPENREWVEAALRESGVEHEVTSFIADIASAYNKSDVIIARSGAGTVAELSVVNRPAILVPLPSSQGGHQFVNAKCLAEVGKAVIVEEGEGFGTRLLEALKSYINPITFNHVVNLPGRLQPQNAAATIANQAIELIHSAKK